MDWCETCGNEVTNGMCVCWCLLADALQQYLGMDHDGSADMAARMWRDLDPEDKRRVWSAEYAEDHMYGQTQQAGQPINTYPRPQIGRVTRTGTYLTEDGVDSGTVTWTSGDDSPADER